MTKKRLPSTGHANPDNVQQQLEQAASKVPLKDYSDYEITIDAKEHFEDALFTDESELQQALNNKPAEPKDDIAKQETQGASPETQAEEIIDYAQFIPRLTEQQLATKASNQLRIYNSRLNDSPARKPIPFGEQADTFKQQLASIEESMQQPVVVEEPNQAKPAESLADKIKLKSQQISRIGKEKLQQSKADLDEYLGRSLPERDFQLGFVLPTTRKNKSSEELPRPRDIQRIFAGRGKDINKLFHRAEESLAQLTKSSAGNTKRLELLDCFAQPLAEKIHSFVNMFERKPCAFEDHNRVAAIEKATTATRLMITGYKQVYADLYESPNVIYGPQRKSANRIAGQLLDWLFLDLQLCLGLHTAINRSTIKTFNSLFYALALYEPDFICEPRPSLASNDSLSPQQLFCLFQIQLTIDYPSFSSRFNKTLASYLKQHQESFQMIPLSISSQIEGLNPGQQLLKVSAFGEKNGELLRPEQVISDVDNNLFIQVQPLLNRIKQDYVNALKLRIALQEKPNLPIFKDFNGQQFIVFLTELNRSVRNLETGNSKPRYSLYQTARIKVYCGFENCIAYSLLDSPTKKDTGETRRPLASKCQWQIAAENDNFLYLQTTEHKTGIALDVGELMLLTVDDNDQESNDFSISRKILVKIARLERAFPEKIQLTVEKISDNFNSIHINELENNAFITKNTNSHFLITKKGSPFKSQQNIDIELADETKATIKISTLRWAGLSMDIFELESPLT